MLSAAEFSRLAARVDNAGRWGDGDELGTLNFLTEQGRREAAGLMRTGTMVSCARRYQPSGPAGPGEARLTLEFDEGPGWKAVNDREGPHALGLLERQRVKTWLATAYAAFDTLPL